MSNVLIQFELFSININIFRHLEVEKSIFKLNKNTNQQFGRRRDTKILIIFFV